MNTASPLNRKVQQGGWSPKKLLRRGGVCFGGFAGVSVVGVETRDRGCEGGRGGVGEEGSRGEGRGLRAGRWRVGWGWLGGCLGVPQGRCRGDSDAR